jgi:hypothetical protein
MDIMLHKLMVRSGSDSLYKTLKHVNGVCPLAPREQSVVIENIILRIPFAPVHGVENAAGIPVFFKGLDRLQALRSYVNGAWPLTGCTGIFAPLDGLLFSELPNLLQNRIEDLWIIAHIVDARVPPGGCCRIPRQGLILPQTLLE